MGSISRIRPPLCGHESEHNGVGARWREVGPPPRRKFSALLVSIFGEMLQKARLETRPNRNGAMRRPTNRLLMLLALALLAVGMAAQFALFRSPVPAPVFVAGAAMLAFVYALRTLPLGARRPIVFV